MAGILSTAPSDRFQSMQNMTPIDVWSFASVDGRGGMMRSATAHRRRVIHTTITFLVAILLSMYDFIPLHLLTLRLILATAGAAMPYIHSRQSSAGLIIATAA